MTLKWNKFHIEKGRRQKIPPMKRWVLLKLEKIHNLGMPGAIVVGYRKDHAGCKDSPYFVTPGCAGLSAIITHWADCLGNEFEWLADKIDD